MDEPLADRSRQGPLSAMLVRYVLTGAVNTSFSYGIYCAAIYLGAMYPVAALVSLVAGICLSFVTMGRIVFRNRLQGRFARFVLLWAVLYVANVGLIRLMLTIGVDAYSAGLAAAVPVVGVSFLVQRYYVFR